MTTYCKHIRMRLECVEPLGLDSHEAMLHGELSDCRNALGALQDDLVEMPANGSTLDALAGDFGKTGGSFCESLANAVAQTDTWKARVDLWIENRDVVTTLAAQRKRLTIQLAERTFVSEGQNCQDVCTLLGEAVQFLTDNVSNVPQELISNFQTLLEDQAQKFIVFSTEDCGSCHWFSRRRRPRSCGTGEGRPGVDQPARAGDLARILHGSVGH